MGERADQVARSRVGGKELRKIDMAFGFSYQIVGFLPMDVAKRSYRH
jgi:1-acyl-sn-glycerol-3-phosphate acyltransferase